MTELIIDPVKRPTKLAQNEKENSPFRNLRGQIFVHFAANDPPGQTNREWSFSLLHSSYKLAVARDGEQVVLAIQEGEAGPASPSAALKLVEEIAGAHKTEGVWRVERVARVKQGYSITLRGVRGDASREIQIRFNDGLPDPIFFDHVLPIELIRGLHPACAVLPISWFTVPVGPDRDSIVEEIREAIVHSPSTEFRMIGDLGTDACFCEEELQSFSDLRGAGASYIIFSDQIDPSATRILGPSERSFEETSLLAMLSNNPVFKYRVENPENAAFAWRFILTTGQLFELTVTFVGNHWLFVLAGIFPVANYPVEKYTAQDIIGAIHTILKKIPWRKELVGFNVQDRAIDIDLRSLETGAGFRFSIVLTGIRTGAVDNALGIVLPFQLLRYNFPIARLPAKCFCYAERDKIAEEIIRGSADTRLIVTELTQKSYIETVFLERIRWRSTSLPTSL